MLIKRKPQRSRRKFELCMIDRDWNRLDEVKEKAQEAGYDIDLEGTLTGYLLRQIDRAENELQKGNESSSAPTEQGA